ncbi:CZB domain-containing protein [Hymenobacter sp. BT635]|uniref:CZB domain-containing protein n=1 Tax=Hymenobacter nitidus TaxID=2880929 RepID=A0ABS8ACN8_9BACT|nr:CZB domain-containing protein [Hymenobacter nitidus]MCB2378175.1 CZB domain-containing protein [Hymenobacter nitidus]
MDLNLKQDFETAMLKHLLFKSKLRSFLYGSALAEGPARDPDQCSLGIWITERRRSAWGHVPEWAALDRAHRQVHQQANELMDMYLQGFTEQAREGLSDLLPLTDRITQLLQTIQDKLRTPR